jgi:LysM repeat protein
MARRNLARIFAPLALVAVVVAGFMIYQQYKDNTRDGSSSSTTPSATTPTTKSGKGKSGKSKKHRARKVYVVKQGDILTTVSEKTGVSVERLQELNPDLDPQSLQVGQRLKLAPEAETDKSDSSEP